MTARLAAGVLVSALRRRVEAAGGVAMVVARGDETAGAVLILAHHRGADATLLERVLGADGYAWTGTGRAGDSLAELEQRAARRRAADPDLWVVEVDIADSERFAAETIGSN